MIKNDNKSRWHDSNPKIQQTFQVVENMSSKERKEFATGLLKAVSILRKQQSRKNFNISLGSDKIMDYCKAYNKRRWYDQIPKLMKAINLLSMLSNEEKEQIIDEISLSLKDKN